MRPNPRIVFPVILLLAVAGAAVWYLTRPTAAQSGVLTASGTIEATSWIVAPELTGRVTAVNAEEGGAVTAGSPLVVFDDAGLAAQQTQAEAALDAAKANLALLEAGPTETQIAALQAQAAAAEAALRAANANLAQITSGSRPETVRAALDRLVQARAVYDALLLALTPDQLDGVRQAAETATGNLEAAQNRRDDLEASDAPSAVLVAADAAIAQAQSAADLADAAETIARDDARPHAEKVAALQALLDAANAGVSLAQARQTAANADERSTSDVRDAARLDVQDTQALQTDAKAAYDALTTGAGTEPWQSAWKEVQAAQTALAAFVPSRGTTAAATTTVAVEAALAQVDAASAQHDAAVANLDNLQAGARAEQIDAAKAQVAAAEAAVEVLRVQRAKLTLMAPADGVVLVRAIEPGEMAVPGAALLTIADLERLTVTVYVPEDRIGEVKLGDAVALTVDSFSDKSFAATVTRIADRAEYTPRNVQTVEGRKTTVFAVQLAITGADGVLKPGMPVDVTFDH